MSGVLFDVLKRVNFTPYFSHKAGRMPSVWIAPNYELVVSELDNLIPFLENGTGCLRNAASFKKKHLKGYRVEISSRDDQFRYKGRVFLLSVTAWLIQNTQDKWQFECISARDGWTDATIQLASHRDYVRAMLELEAIPYALEAPLAA